MCQTRVRPTRRLVPSQHKGTSRDGCRGCFGCSFERGRTLFERVMSKNSIALKTRVLATFRRKIRLSLRTDHQWAVARTRKSPAAILPGSEVIDPGAVRKIRFYE